MAVALHGRRVIYTDQPEVTVENVVAVLRKALPTHWKNRNEVEYLWNYRKGRQDIRNRVKQVRPEICNKIVVNHADEIVSFKTHYLMGKPIQYVLRGEAETYGEEINLLNEFIFVEEKASKDLRIADWFHTCGTAFRMVLPAEVETEYSSPFETYVLDPRNTFVVYYNGLGEKPLMGVTYVTDENGLVHYSCYTRDFYAEIVDSKVMSIEPHILGRIPIVEYPLNQARVGSIELVHDLLEAINLTLSNQMDGLEQFIQALMLFHNVDISSDDFTALREEGAIKFKDIDPQLKAEVKYLVNTLNQGETQSTVDHMYQMVLTICGIPNRNGGSSTSDTGAATQIRDGWETANQYAAATETMFCQAERQVIELILNICKVTKGLTLKPTNVDIRFTRRNYENILQKAQVLDLLLKNPKVHPRLAFEHSGLFTDPDLAYSLSEEYAEEQEKKMQEIMKEEKVNDSDPNAGNEGADRDSAETRQPSRNPDRAG